jgi:hypothetical protein
VAAFPDAAAIYERYIATLRRLGHEVSAIRMFDVLICTISDGHGRRLRRVGCDGATHNK